MDVSKMMKRLTALSIFIFLPIMMLAILFLAPLPIHYKTDFSILYFANKALLHGIHLYDYPGQMELLPAFPGLVFTPYPYPPWYALATLPIAFLPVETAARMWFLFNLTMIAAATWLLTPNWQTPLRLFFILLAILFVPAFGLLVVGQYSAPVLFGAALFVWSAKEKSSYGIAASLGLMTFKPHIGLFLLLTGLGWLLHQRKNVFARRALLITSILAVAMLAIGFLADPAWPLTYFESLGLYRDIPGVQSCELCASLSVGIVRVLAGEPDFEKAVMVSLFLTMGLAGLYFAKLRTQLYDAANLMALSTIFTLLVYPYLLNYDYILLLIPFAVLAKRVKLLYGHVIMIGAYLLPWGILVYGRGANLLLAISSLILLALFLRPKTL
jgi:hypothetical protein